MITLFQYEVKLETADYEKYLFVTNLTASFIPSTSVSFILLSCSALILWRRIKGEFICDGSEITADFITTHLMN